MAIAGVVQAYIVALLMLLLLVIHHSKFLWLIVILVFHSEVASRCMLEIGLTVFVDLVSYVYWIE